MAAETVPVTRAALLACVVAALADIDRPVCDSGSTIGPPVIGPDSCCKCSDDSDGRVVAYVERTYPVDGTSFEQIIPRNCRRTAIAADIVLVVVRCFPRISETGVMPSLEATTEAADNLDEDMSAAWNAIECCGDNLGIREIAVDSDPEGGCSAFGIRVTTLVTMPALEGVGS